VVRVSKGQRKSSVVERPWMAHVHYYQAKISSEGHTLPLLQHIRTHRTVAIQHLDRVPGGIGDKR
jgi:hypothetical protein